MNARPETARRRWPWILVVLLVLALAAGAWQRSRSKPPAYVTAPVARGDIVETVAANGTLNPVTLVSVGTQVSGTVEKLHADFNDRVGKGDVLLELDERTYAAAVRQSEANVRSAAAQAELAAANEKRAEDLFAKGYISQQERDQARQQARSSAAQRDLTRAQLDRDRTNLGYTVIRSPVSGVVVARLVDVGQTVAASFQTPTLFQIAQDLKKMQIDSNFAEADIGRIHEGSAVRFTVDAYPDRTFDGRVRQVRLNPKTVQNVVTYNVVVAVDNADEVLLPGMTAYVNVVLQEQKNVLRVPNAALRFRPPGAAGAAAASGGDATNAAGAAAGGGSRAGPGAAAGPGRAGGGSLRENRAAGASRVRTLYVLRGRDLVPVRVTLGPTDRRYTAILGGDLREGDLVVTASAGAEATADGGARRGGPPGMRMF